MLLNWALPVERLLEAERSESVEPAADIVATDDGYRLVVEMPGVTRENLTVDLENDTLTLRGSRQAVEKDKSLVSNSGLADRSFVKRFTLGRDLDRARIEAKLGNGLLTVTLPRGGDSKPTRIEVSGG